MKIQNSQTKVSETIELNDKDYMTNLLSILKCLEKDMAVVLTEASNEILYKEYKNIFDKICEFQRNAYELMFKFGWYELEKASKNKIDNELKTLTKDYDSLNN